MAEPLRKPGHVAASTGAPGPDATVDPDCVGTPTLPRKALPLRGALITAAVLAGLWAVLLPGDPASWWLGVPAVLGGAAVTLLRPSRDHRRLRLSLPGALKFAAYFTVQSLRGASDVAWRACQPRMPIDPGFQTYTMSLPDGPAQLIMANVITLLPGTLSAELQGSRIVVHMLDQTQDLSADLGALERRVAALFGLSDTDLEQTA